MSNPHDLELTARKAVDGALARGVKGVRAVAYRGRNVAVTYRKGRPDKIQESTRRSLTLHLYIDGRYTACESNDLRPAALDSFIDNAVALARAMTSDPFRLMPDPALYEGREERDLGLFDPAVAGVTPAERNERASAVEQATMAAAGERALSVEASWEDEEAEVFQLHSNGFEGNQRGSQFWMSAEVSLRDEGDKRPSGWDLAGSRRHGGLPEPERVGKGCAERARQRLGAHKVETRKAPMIVENRAVGRLLGHLLGAISGRAVQQKRSFLTDKLGQGVGSKLLDLVDDPFVQGGFGSRLFDGEGISARVMPVIEKGVLKSFFIDTYYGKKLDMAPTTGSSSNLILTPGTKSLDGLVTDVGDGILVRGFIGGNTNPVTGDFSLGVYGTLIKKGKLTDALAEMNISGNHLDLWQHLTAVGSDVWEYSKLRTPSLVFDSVQFSGS
ncbi:MAG TPA: TldD/PmbA family protein [Polyangia bacterium]|nr:TldD/PmbA family protein [Polyangia bacterium]